MSIKILAAISVILYIASIIVFKCQIQYQIIIVHFTTIYYLVVNNEFFHQNDIILSCNSEVLMGTLSNFAKQHPQQTLSCH